MKPTAIQIAALKEFFSKTVTVCPKDYDRSKPDFWNPVSLGVLSLVYEKEM